MGKFLITFAVLGTNCGIAIGYLCAIGQSLYKIFGLDSDGVVEAGWYNIPLFGGMLHINTLLWMLFPVLWILNLLKLKNLQFTSLLGNAAVVVTLVVVICKKKCFLER